MSSGSAHRIAIVEESTWGVTPNNPRFQILRNAGTTLALSKNTIESDEIRSDRMTADIRHGSYTVGGEINFDLSYGTYDSIFEATLQNTWQPKAHLTAVTTVSVNATDDSFNDSATGFSGFEVNEPIEISGFTNSENNGVFTVKTITAGKLTVNEATLIVETAGQTISIKSKRATLKVGSIRKSFTIERHFSDLASVDNPYHLYTGCEVNSLNLTISADDKISGSINLLGTTLVTSAAPIPGSEYNPTRNSGILDSFNGSIKEGNVTNSVITELSLNIENGLESRMVIGSKQSIQASNGRNKTSGDLTGYFQNSTLLNKFINETTSSIEFTLPSSDGTYKITVPKIKYMGGQPDVSGEGSITLGMPYTALLDPFSNTNLIIERTPNY